MAHNGEASVEEILESIKKVIARDNRDGAAQLRRQREVEPETVEEREEGPVTEEPREEVLDLSEMELDDVVHEEDVADFDDAEEDDEPLIRTEIRSAMQQNLAALATISQPGARPQIVRSGETSLEGLTRELLRPMLAEWLDANLPGMVEKLVQAEIARIAGKKN